MDRGAFWATVQWGQKESDMTDNGARVRVHNFPFSVYYAGVICISTRLRVTVNTDLGRVYSL